MQPILFLYKDHQIKYKNTMKLKKEKLSNPDLKMILIPLFDDENAYIPIKPSRLYLADKFYVEMDQQVISYEFENGDINEGELLHSELTTRNVIEFINKLYTIYKCRGASIIIEDGNSYCPTVSHVICIRKILIKFFDANQKLITEIDTGDMGTLDSQDDEWESNSPPAFRWDERFHYLNEIFFTYDNSSKEIGKTEMQCLPISIKITEDYWQKVKKPGRELSANDQILYKIDDFDVYYCMPYALYLAIIRLPDFSAKIMSIPINTPQDVDPLPCLDENRIPTSVEKHQFIDAFDADEYFAVINNDYTIASVSLFLIMFVFLDTICWYTHYISYSIFNDGKSDSTKIKTVVVFYNKMLTDYYQLLTMPELTSHSIAQNSIIEIVNKLSKE